jgi:lipoprotein-anchoring transpeptidase ErfK/SrfK
MIILFFSYYKALPVKEFVVGGATSTIPLVEKVTTPSVKLTQYIEVIDGCGPYYSGTCVNMREGAGSNFPVYARLRTGIVLRVGGTVNVDGKDWYKIIFASELLYPERVKTDLYVASGDYLRYFNDIGDQYQDKKIATTTKRIVIDLSENTLYAYDGDILFMKELISTGLEFTPTPRGTFSVFKKTPARYMQGPLPGVSDQVYDLPGVPWDLYFTEGGAVIHGAYWHDHFGKPWSHGCVNLSPQNAKKLYEWSPIGIKVTVQN